MKLKIPPVVVFVAFGALIWLIDYLSGPTFQFKFEGQRMVSRIILVIGAYLGFSGVFTFRRKRTTVDPMNPKKATSLVDNGIYSFTRNPMYLGLAFILLAFGIRLGNPLSLFGLIGFLLYMTSFQIKPEESALEELFGEEYSKYKTRVRRWL